MVVHQFSFRKYQKNFRLFAAIILCTFCSVAQTAQQVTVHLGTIGTATTVSGKPSAIRTTRAEMLANTTLIADVAGALVKQYTISFLPKGGEYYGPFTVAGADLNDQARHKIKETAQGGRIFIEGIKVVYNGTETAVPPVLLSYDR